MRVMGIDCGAESTGFGFCDLGDSQKLVHVAAGAIQPARRETMPLRLRHIHETLCALIREHAPDVVAIEEVFYSVNAKSALKLGQVRGVALLAAAECGVPVAEYAPLAVKSAVVGYGHAEKEQVKQMVVRLLDLNEPPESYDACDALALAICHLHTHETLSRQGAAK